MSHASCLVALPPMDDLYGPEIERLVSYQMEPFDENGQWFKDGSRWDWWQIGGRYGRRLLGRDYLRRRDLNEDAMNAFAAERAQDIWSKWQKEERKDEFLRSQIYGFSADETLASLTLNLQQKRISAYAFLKDRRWHENGRMGWFGSSAKTECEIEHGHTGVCLHQDEQTGARIVSYNHDEEGWGLRFFDRFVKDLEPDTVLVLVDYHV